MNSTQPESPRATIANQIVRLHSEYYGRGPTKAKTYMVDDLVVVVLEETFTPVERTLIERGEIDAIREIRHRFQMAMEVQFTSVIEAATGRRVRAFMSETDLDSDTSVEVFLLHTARTSAASDVEEITPPIDATKAAEEGEAAARDGAQSTGPAVP
jgi:uncharacterized protein YbcI